MAQIAKTNRAAVLRAAMRLLAANGLSGISIRSVAGELGLAPNAIYHYFASREDLEVAVASEVAAMLHAALMKAGDGMAPEEAVRSLVEAYLAFAREHRLLYEALVVPRPASGEEAVAPELLWRYVLAQVSRVSGAAMSRQAAVAMWAMLHGMAALQSADAFNEEMPRDSLDFAVDAWLAAARAAGAKEAGAKSRRGTRRSTTQNISQKGMSS